MGDIGIQEFYEKIGANPPASAQVEDRTFGGGNQQAQGVAKGETESRATKQAHAFETCSRLLNAANMPLSAIRTPPRPDPTSLSVKRIMYSKTSKTKYSGVQSKWRLNFTQRGKKPTKRREQAASYVSYLLNARPDLVAALGLLVEVDGLVFFFCNANGIKKLSLSNADDYLPLLSAIVKYLNEGQTNNIDKTLSRVPSTVLYNVSVPNDVPKGSSPPSPTEYKSCSLRYSRDPFGRRPNIFIYKPGNDVSAIRVIKDQYIKRGRRWVEKDVLTKIHAHGVYPAVDYGTDFLSLKTLRDVIYALYDLLEVTRGLYLDRRILHRDISPWNIMIRDSEYTQSIKTCSSASPVFIRHLLDPQVPKHESSIFLIDFGYGQDLESPESPLQGRTIHFPELPPLSERIGAAYKSNHPERVELFKKKLGGQIEPWGADRGPAVFQHKLEHDGESGIWSSFWWALQAFPEQGENVPIRAIIWTALMPEYDVSQTGLPQNDERDVILTLLRDGHENILHPEYRGLLDLFQSMAEAIQPDYYWAEPGIQQSPEFVHEILQRIILNFVVKNKDESFMDQRKDNKNRTVQGKTSTAFLSTAEAEHRRTTSMESPAVIRKHTKRKIQETLPNPTPPKHAMSGGNEPNDSDTADEDAQHIEKKAHIGDV
ncbi:hypothetical protein AGABI1DRAFT_94862 [Agaricus bisporus var. burnettii JB137-S8]|uniref:Fungal-type protein kinase domain-containing protein n=1 Tax=Agaricus bisporus var. burnettii (strain JB137-S8 / ATCC MYA-4627 / FGSC 10392) TaxID=597362 RepID=K5VLY3_AGABU|nr:uncharacterized protein AGABI1DRAFT_94862 [Agaricus bisporus var. burnettii JB137-S8]EKM75434.1 hypothetical protein AGABI1DRAFT_94862 [Agaricus bisporus var. burnettii JB137-S8]